MTTNAGMDSRDSGQATMAGFPILLRPREAARLLGFTEGSLAIFRCTGRHPGLRFVRLPGGSIRYRLSDIQNFIEGRGCDESGSQEVPARRRGGPGRPPKVRVRA